MLSAAKMASLVAGLLLILSGLNGAGSLVLGLTLGAGVIIFSGRLRHRVWSAVFLAAGLLALFSFGGIVGQVGAVAMVIAASLGLASTFV
ncbi:MAG: hypothetical protein JRN06_06520 [Nitrososphaerota archaeon]|nr:hypothetical protein [Nitrososphaerota archaeon]